jgi:transposase
LSLSLPPSAKIYLSLAPCDMRKGFDGLSAQVRNILQLDPFSGAVFLFRGKRGDRLKALVWDGSGLCLYANGLSVGNLFGHGPGMGLPPGSRARSWRC